MRHYLSAMTQLHYRAFQQWCGTTTDLDILISYAYWSEQKATEANIKFLQMS